MLIIAAPLLFMHHIEKENRRLEKGAENSIEDFTSIEGSLAVVYWKFVSYGPDVIDIQEGTW